MKMVVSRESRRWVVITRWSDYKEMTGLLFKIQKSG